LRSDGGERGGKEEKVSRGKAKGKGEREEISKV